MVAGRQWRMAGRLDDGKTFERGYLKFVSWSMQRVDFP